jgi:ER-bound oxygenase mpaB/B'/Rubber oxygenase, catalytic domain
VPDPAENQPPWPAAFLEQMRSVGDPVADGVMAQLFRDGDIAAVNDLMRNMVANEYPAPESLPAAVRDYLTETDVLPEWADPGLIEAGEQLFWRYGTKLILVLYCYSLPFCYLGKNGVQVLALTNRLGSNPTRRIIETAQLLVDMMQAGGLTTPQGRGRRTIQKVRLMHAAIRQLAPTAPQWKADFGTPVNQEDLAGTLMSFSWIALDGLDKLGMEVTPAQQEAFLHCWLVAGHLLGIRAELLPRDVANARALAEAIAAHQFGPCAEGQALTKALIDMLATTPAGDVFRHAAPLLIRCFLGETWAGWLGVAEPRWETTLLAPLRLLGFQANTLTEHSKKLSEFAEHAGRLIVESIVFVGRGGNRPSFSIPVDLREQWGINWRS